MIIINPALLEDEQSCQKLAKSLQASFAENAFLWECAKAASGGEESKDVLLAFIQFLVSAFIEAAKDVSYAAGPPQSGSKPRSSEERPGSYESWVMVFCSSVEESVDLDMVYANSPAANALEAAEASGEEEEPSDVSTSLTAAQAWAEIEIETILDGLISKKTLLELPDIPFQHGCKVLALLTEDGQYHPAVVLREMNFADMWEGDHRPEETEEEATELAEAIGDDNSVESGYPETQGADPKACKQKKNAKKVKALKPIEIFDAWVKNRFFEVRFPEFDKKQFVRFDNLMLNDLVEDDEGVEGMMVEEGDCEVCRRSIFLTFHHLIPKQTHNRWLKRKRLPEGVRGYESGSRKKLPSSAVTSADSKKASSKGKKADPKKPAKSTSSCKKDENCNRYFLNTYGIMVCRQCHGQIHHMASNMELAKRYNTLDRVLNAPLMQRCIGWKA